MVATSRYPFATGLLAKIESSVGSGVDLSALETSIGRAYDGAVAAWPGVEVTGAAFVGRLAEALREHEGAVEDALARLSVVDLYLCAGCLEGDPRALGHLELLLSRAKGYISRIDSSPRFVDDVLQAVRVRLLVGTTQGPARLTTYSGRGPLARWVAVTAQNVALNLRHDQAASPSRQDDVLTSFVSLARDPEADLINAEHKAEVERALREAIAAFSVRERTLLRLSLIEGLTLDRVATIYKVNASTVSRWLARIRATVLERTEAHLRQALRMDVSQIGAMIGLVQSRVDVSLGGLLAPSRPADDG